jgi:hypothetical protein
MATRLSLEEKRKVAAYSPTVIQKTFLTNFNYEPPFRLVIYQVYEKFVKTGSVADNLEENCGHKRTGRSPENIAATQEVFV